MLADRPQVAVEGLAGRYDASADNGLAENHASSGRLGAYWQLGQRLQMLCWASWQLGCNAQLRDLLVVRSQVADDEPASSRTINGSWGDFIGR